MVFHIGVEHGKTFERTWDLFLMPRPFSQTVILFAPPIYVPADANAEVMEANTRKCSANWNAFAILRRAGFR